MNISTPLALPAGLTYDQRVKAKNDLQQAADARRREVQADVGKAFSSPRLSGPETAKQQAKAKLEQIKERLTILRKLFGSNPKEMARALAQVFKELRAAIKDYKDAGGQELAMSGDLASAAVAPQTPAAKDEGAAAPEGDKPADDEAKVEADTPSTTPGQGACLYDAVVGEMRKSIGEDGLDFVKLVRGLSNAISDLLETARGQAKAAKPNEDTDKIFEHADKELGKLREDMSAMERDIHQQVPTAGMRLSVAA